MPRVMNGFSISRVLPSRASRPSLRAVSARLTIWSISSPGWSGLAKNGFFRMAKMFITCFSGKPTKVTAIAPPKTIIIAGGSMNLVSETCDSPTINTPTIMAKPMSRPRTVLISMRTGFPCRGGGGERAPRLACPTVFSTAHGCHAHACVGMFFTSILMPTQAWAWHSRVRNSPANSRHIIECGARQV